jgi:hypothetical protein
MAQPPPPPYGGDPDNPYGQQPPSYTPPPPHDPYAGGGYQQAPPPPQDPYAGTGYQQQAPSYTPPPAPGAYYGGPVQYGAAGYPAQSNNSLALISMICGIGGLVLMFFCGLGFLPGVAALVLGFVGRSQINQSGGAQGGSGMALTGIITGGVAVALSAIIFIIVLATGVFSAFMNSNGGG